jgi:hypothetical protein
MSHIASPQHGCIDPPHVHLPPQLPLHCPHELHETTEQPLMQVEPGVQTGAGAEHAPQLQLAEQISLPHPLHACVLPGLQTP